MALSGSLGLITLHWLCAADYSKLALWCWWTKTGHMAFGGLCGVEYTRLALWCWFTTGHMALGGSVVLITLDRLCGADLPRLTVLPWVALWCWFTKTDPHAFGVSVCSRYTKTACMALCGSVVLITLDGFCGADLPRLTLMPWVSLCVTDLPRLLVWPCVALWCWLH